MTKPIQLDQAAVKKILVCQLRQIGDVLLATPSITLLAGEYPNAEIHVFTEKKCVPMLEGNPHIHKIWQLDKAALPTLWHQLRYYKTIAEEQFDIIVDFQQLPRTKWVVLFSNAPIKLTYPPKWYNRLLYTHWAQTPGLSAVPYKASTLEPLGITWNGQKPLLHLSEEEYATGTDILTAHGIDHNTRFFSIDATHRHRTREWPAHHYAALIDELQKSYPDAFFFLHYGPGEKDKVLSIQQMTSQSERVVVTEEMLPLRIMAAVMSRAFLHIGNCSSPRHIAVAFDVPTVTVLGSTSSGWTFPSPLHRDISAGLSCQPCNKNSCPRQFECLETLAPKTVLTTIQTHLDHLQVKSST